MRYGTFHKRFTLWNIRMLLSLFSENYHLLFSWLPMFFAGLLLYRDLLRYSTATEGSFLFDAFLIWLIFTFWALLYRSGMFILLYFLNCLYRLYGLHFIGYACFPLPGWSDSLLYVLIYYRSFTRLLTCFVRGNVFILLYI